MMSMFFMHTSTSPSRAPSSRHVQALRSVQGQGRYLLTTREFARAAGLEKTALSAKSALDRLTSAGFLATLDRRGRRLIVPPEHAHYGAPPVDWWLDDMLAALEPHYHVALLSAARHWGSAHHALQATQVMVAKPRRDLVVGKRKLCFFTKKSIASTPVVTVSNGVAPWRVSSREATLLDLLHHTARLGGLEAVARIVRDLHPRLDPAALTAALTALGQRASAQRLGFVLEHLGARAKVIDPVRRWLKADVRTTGKPLQAQQLDRGSVAEHALSDPTWLVRHDARHLRLLEELR